MSQIEHNLNQLLQPMGRSRRSRLARGVTLIEILIVLAIIGLIAGGVAAVAIPKLAEARIKTAKTDCISIHGPADLWRADHQNECPTLDALKAAKTFAAGGNTNDPWGKPYQIRCDSDELRVFSYGPDGKDGTADDISVPEVAKGE